MNRRLSKRWAVGVIAGVIVLTLTIAGGSAYMLQYSLGYQPQNRKSASLQRNRVRHECPWTAAWMDSVYQHHCVRDTLVVMPAGYKAHALFIYAPHATTKTAVVVHGYKMRAEGMLHIAYLYNHDLRYNVLLPDLYAHGQSEGDHIQMGWNDRQDVIRWAEIADEIFSKRSRHDSAKEHTMQVLHGISMGAATIMAASGENTPNFVKCFVEDCGYTSVWGEFAAQLKNQFALPSFPLMYTTSGLCKLKYGWSFAEASQLDQVARSTKPMLFIHGDNDDFVPSWMLYPLFKAKRCGPKALWIAKGSAHAMAYRDHHKEYTQTVKHFIDHSLHDD